MSEVNGTSLPFIVTRRATMFMNAKIFRHVSRRRVPCGMETTCLWSIKMDVKQEIVYAWYYASLSCHMYQVDFELKSASALRPYLSDKTTDPRLFSMREIQQMLRREIKGATDPTSMIWIRRIDCTALYNVILLYFKIMYVLLFYFVVFRVIVLSIICVFINIYVLLTTVL